MSQQTLLNKFYQWPLIARDIILLAKEGSVVGYGVPEIAKSYGLSEEEFVELSQLDAFRSVVKSEMDRFKKLGPRAGYKLRTEALITDIQERVYAKVRDGLIDDKSVLQFLNMLMRSVGYDQPSDEEKKSASDTPLVSIAFNVPNLKNNKLAHLVSQPQNKVIEAQ